jgi:hypothetical protein
VKGIFDTPEDRKELLYTAKGDPLLFACPYQNLM